MDVLNLDKIVTIEDIKKISNEQNLNIDILKKMIQQWINLDKKIQEVNNSLKEVKSEKEQLEVKIMSYVDNNNLDKIPEVNNTILEIKTTQSKQKIDEEYIKKKLEKFDKDVEKIDKITKSIFDEVEITEKRKLSIQKVSKPKPKPKPKTTQ